MKALTVIGWKGWNKAHGARISIKIFVGSCVGPILPPSVLPSRAPVNRDRKVRDERARHEILLHSAARSAHFSRVPSTNLTFQNRNAHREWLAAQATLPAGFRVGSTRFDFMP